MIPDWFTGKQILRIPKWFLSGLTSATPATPAYPAHASGSPNSTGLRFVQTTRIDLVDLAHEMARRSAKFDAQNVRCYFSHAV
ncbi:MAG: hypothetical protein ACK53G_07130 [Armatimonadota bacterium]